MGLESFINCISQWTFKMDVRMCFFFVFQGHTESNIYEIMIPFIYRHIFCGKFNLQLFKAMRFVMNYFVILPLMRFIFNNCNNYFIKKEEPCIMAISARSRVSEDSHQEGIITPAGLSFTLPNLNYIMCQQCLH